jgi:hypothetical protein
MAWDSLVPDPHQMPPFRSSPISHIKPSKPWMIQIHSIKAGANFNHADMRARPPFLGDPAVDSLTLTFTRNWRQSGSTGSATHYWSRMNEGMISSLEGGHVDLIIRHLRRKLPYQLHLGTHYPGPCRQWVVSSGQRPIGRWAKRALPRRAHLSRGGGAVPCIW